MPKYFVQAKLETYATVVISAPSAQAARVIADADGNDDDGLDWDYETDFDSSKVINISELE